MRKNKAAEKSVDLAQKEPIRSIDEFKQRYFPSTDSSFDEQGDPAQVGEKIARKVTEKIQLFSVKR